MSDPSADPASAKSDSANPASTSGGAALETVDWDEVGGWRARLSAELVVLVAGLLGLCGAFVYHRATGGGFLVGRWLVGWEDWLLLLALVVVVAAVVTPLVRRPRRARRLASRLRGRWGTLASLGVVGSVVTVGTWVVVGGFRARLTLDPLQPPVFGSIPDQILRECVGPTTDESIRSRDCLGTWEYPLGTDRMGYDVIDVLVQGTEPVAYVAIVTVGLIVPLATAVGVLAGYYGGLLDDLLMAYVDLQLSVPAIAVYLLAYMFVANSPVVFLIAFGLLSWGGIARIVRSETLTRREEGYVLAARAAGASGPSILRRHVLPNVTNSVVPATLHLIAVLVLTEAGLAFLGFYAFPRSWGETIEEALQFSAPLEIWWISTVPAVALAVTVLACKVAGDGFRDVLDPRGGR